jgi:hypothetical protein
VCRQPWCLLRYDALGLNAQGAFMNGLASGMPIAYSGPSSLFDRHGPDSLIGIPRIQ